ncbi:hypothetical protein KC19_VG235400 [Ceratodon purpureus]|uniref:Uncharacterized protein n=1 Tax=Ceratodon purpureus TaxID=3225 RepID=A0A8T0HT40_CERPU|nr:hypothetical protein KC19_VG235400 [Ceratodon purpureus]
MAVSMATVLSTHTKKIIANAPYFFISADEVTSIDHQSRLSLPICVVVGFKRVSILLALQHLVEENGAIAVLEAILTNLNHHGGLLRNQIAEKRVTFGADGVSVFQGSRTGVTTHLKEKHAPFMLGVHCMDSLHELGCSAYH